MNLRNRIGEAAAAIRRRSPESPEFAVILGTGLGPLASAIEDRRTLSYEEIPHFARPTSIGHRGEMVLGTLEGRRVAAMEGRLHAYEGYSPDQITFPVRVLRALGAKGLLVTCASGGLDPAHRRGDLVLLDDHINLMNGNPLIGPNDDALGPRFPDMSRPYDPAFLSLAERVAKEEGVPLRRGVYAALSGPSLETRAEYRFLRTIGADLVGMSTVPEVIVGVHAGLRILGISVVTDLCDPDHLQPVNLKEILAVAASAEPSLTKLVRRVIREAKV